MKRKKHPVPRLPDVHPRLKNAAEIAVYRKDMLAKQFNICPLCDTPITADKAVLDHAHGSGHIRAVLHRGCNTILSKVENNYKRMGVSMDQLYGMCSPIAEFLEDDYSANPFHPLHRTSEEKRVARNARARKG